MSDYTSTTEEVRDNCTWGASACGCCAEYRDEDYEKFDRWLATHDAEVAAKALEEAAVGIFVRPASADAVYDALRARAAEIREKGQGE